MEVSIASQVFNVKMKRRSSHLETLVCKRLFLGFTISARDSGRGRVREVYSEETKRAWKLNWAASGVAALELEKSSQVNVAKSSNTAENGRRGEKASQMRFTMSLRQRPLQGEVFAGNDIGLCLVFQQQSQGLKSYWEKVLTHLEVRSPSFFSIKTTIAIKFSPGPS